MISIGLLYGIAFTIKMSKKGDHQIDGYFDYVVPPLKGFWWQGERRPVDAIRNQVEPQGSVYDERGVIVLE